MAHGRTGPDIVMNTRYAGPSEVRSVSVHEEKRIPDGASAIDPDRSELNRLLWSFGPEPETGEPDLRPRTQSEALEQLWASGVKKPAQQSEKPFVQMVISASPEYFRDEAQGEGEWNKEKLDKWIDATMKWLRKEYGDDLIHVSLHLDEDTPHVHVLIAPTYGKKPRKPGRRKRNETEEEFEARKAEAENAGTVRTVGRASNDYWKRAWARREARLSYHKAVESLGIGYGKDFVGSDEPSPKHVKTGIFVREKAEELRKKEKELLEREHLIEEKVQKKEEELSKALIHVEEQRRKLDEEVEGLKEDRSRIFRLGDRIVDLVKAVASKLGVTPQLSEIERGLEELRKEPEPKAETSSLSLVEFLKKKHSTKEPREETSGPDL